jgi:hypothetical protein
VTTIAYDGLSLASDTQASMLRSTAEKIHRLKDGSLFGSCGELQDNVAVREWLEGGGEKPKVSDGFHAIHVRGGVIFTLENKLIAMKQQRDFFAVGSGRDFAMAAMHLGKTAAEAVKVSHLFDVDTGPEVAQLDHYLTSLDNAIDNLAHSQQIRERLYVAGQIARSNGRAT